MESSRDEDHRTEQARLLRKQEEVLESCSFGTASETEVLEYEIRQEVVHEICNQLARSIAS